MRQVVATFLLILFGILIPAAATPFRVCLLDGKLVDIGMPLLKKAEAADSKCCGGCDDPEHHENCCAELKKIQDTTRPAPSVDLPEMVACELPPVVFAVQSPRIEVDPLFHPTVPIRGPDSPSAHRAMLAIWRI